eukprot:scaffold36081_cov63-Phaeocystis_antarctica.AAC.3
MPASTSGAPVRPVHHASKAAASLRLRSDPHDGGVEGRAGRGTDRGRGVAPSSSGGEISGVQSHPLAEGGEATWPTAIPSSGSAWTTGSPLRSGATTRQHSRLKSRHSRSRRRTPAASACLDESTPHRRNGEMYDGRGTALPDS